MRLKIIVRWGDYRARKPCENEPGPYVWQRTPYDERVLVELIELNKQRAEEERLIGLDVSPKKVRAKNSPKKKKDETGLLPLDRVMS